MIIKNITIENFQSYYNSHTLEFSKGLNLIIGNGGKGKSKLFNAFYWVLFGKIYITSNGWCTTDTLPNSANFVMRRHDFLNKKALFETPINGEVKCSVRIEIEDDRGKIYFIERSVNAIRQEYENWDDEKAWIVQPNILKISFDSITGSKVLTNDFEAEEKINELFPLGIRNYIWFQGEALESLINFRKKETLKAAVKHISYFPYYEKLSDIISQAKIKITSQESRRLKEVNKNNSTLNGLLKRGENLRYKIEKEETDRKVIENNIDQISIALTDGENKISGLAGFTRLVSEYQACNHEIENLVAEATRIDDFQRQKLRELWILRKIQPMIEECKTIIEQHKEEEFTVPEKKYLDQPSRAKLEEILKDKKCFVCGTEFTEKDAQYHYITERLKLQETFLKEMEDYHNNMQLSKSFNMFVGKIQDYPDSLLVSLSEIEKQWTSSDDDMDKCLLKRKKFLSEKETLDKQIEEIKKKHGVDPVTEADTAENINTTIRVSRKNLETQRRKLEDSKQRLNEYKKELHEVEQEMYKLNKKNSIEKVSETEWKHISTFLEDICKRVQENARKELLIKLEERANDFYTRFTEHDNGYKGNVKIGDDYSIEFDPGLNTSHEDRKKMSIINALLSLNQEAMNAYYPFISDAPTSNFDLETTHKYLLGIKDIFGQSIILTKDVDLESENYRNLRNQETVSRIYLLESEIYSGSADRGQHEVSTRIKTLK